MRVLAAAALLSTACRANAPAVIDRNIAPPVRDAPGTRFHGAVLADDRRSIRVDFVGGPEFDPDDPCSVDYEGTADVVGTELVVGVVPLPHRAPIPEGHFCTFMGHPRSMVLTLDAAFDGLVIRGVDGAAFLLERPRGVATITGLPDGWQMRGEGNPMLRGSTPAWQQEWSPHERPEAVEGASRVILVQAFGGPVADRVGGQPVQVDIDGQPGAFRIHEDTGEMSLEWSVGDDGFALFGYRSDFSPEAFVALAETVTTSAD